MSKCCTLFLAAALLSACATVSQPTSALEPQPGDFSVSDFSFENGSSLPALTLHYSTFGTPQFDSAGRCSNAVLLLHDTIGNTALQAGGFFTAKTMREALFGPGQPLDASKYYLIIPDALGHGFSTKPSDGLRRRFPNYSDSDLVQAQHRLVTEGLSINHLKLVLGLADGGLQTWLWGERYPDMMDALMPIASPPTMQGGRMGLWQRMATQAIYTDPDWQQGDYVKQPKKWLDTVALSSLLERNTLNLDQAASTPEQVEKMAGNEIKSAYKVRDANDALYAFEAAKKGPNPQPSLSKIQARVYALYFQDDAFYTDSAKEMQALIRQIPQAQVIEIEGSQQTDGHATIARPEVWKGYITQLLTQPDKPVAAASNDQPKNKVVGRARPLANAKTNTQQAHKQMVPVEDTSTVSQAALSSNASTDSSAADVSAVPSAVNTAGQANQAIVPIPIVVAPIKPVQKEDSATNQSSETAAQSAANPTTAWSSNQSFTQTIVSPSTEGDSTAASPIVTSESSGPVTARSSDTASKVVVQDTSAASSEATGNAITPTASTDSADIKVARPIASVASPETAPAPASIRESNVIPVTPPATKAEADSAPKAAISDAPTFNAPRTETGKALNFLPSPVPRPIS